MAALDRVVNIDGDRGLYLRCTGTGSPTVVMEGGDGDTSDSYSFAEEPFLHDQVSRGVVTLSTGDGLEPFIDAEDIAEVAAVTLTEDGHAGQTYELSGPRLMTFGEAIETITRLGGHDVRFVAGTSEECVASLEAHGISHESSVFIDQLFLWIGEGRKAMLADGVQRVLGREPNDFEEYVRRTPAEAWRG